MAPIIIKPTFAFEVGATFIFGSWLYIADGIGGFQRCIIKDQEKKYLGENSLQQEAVDLAEKIKNFDLINIEFDYNSDSTTARTSPCELAIKPSRRPTTTPSQFPYRLRNTVKVHQ